MGGAQVSEKHSNFLLNLGDATSADIEALGEEVRAPVKATVGRRPRMGNSAGGASDDMLPSLHVAVLMGGWSAEREVSLMCGRGRRRGAGRARPPVTRIDMDRDVAARLAEAKPDVVFNALHGAPGEDGTVQGMLDLMGLPYTHSRPRHLGDRDRQGADQAGAGAARHPDARRADRQERRAVRRAIRCRAPMC